MLVLCNMAVEMATKPNGVPPPKVFHIAERGSLGALPVSSRRRLLESAYRQPWYEAITGPVPDNYSAREKVNYVLHRCTAGFVWEICQAVFTLSACAVYVAQTYGLSGTEVRRQPRFRARSLLS